MPDTNQTRSDAVARVKSFFSYIGDAAARTQDVQGKLDALKQSHPIASLPLQMAGDVLLHPTDFVGTGLVEGPETGAFKHADPKAMIEKAGAIYSGAQDYGTGLMHFFIDPLTGSSHMLPEAKMSPESIATKMTESRGKFAGGSKGLPTPPMKPQELADMQAENPARLLTEDKARQILRSRAAQHTIDAGLAGDRRDHLTEMREADREKMKK